MNENNEFKYSPCNIKMLMNIASSITADKDLHEYISQNQFDSLEISWLGIFLKSVRSHFKSVDWSKYNERMNSLLYCCLENQTMQLMWIVFSICHGQYEMALRELRSLIENAFLFYRIDQLPEMLYSSGTEKFTYINSVSERDKFGKPVFEKSMYSNWKQVYEHIYKPLCSFVHTSETILSVQDAYDEYYWNAPVFDKDKIKKCLYFFQKIVLTETDLMKTQLKEVYGIDISTNEITVFDTLIIPAPTDY